MTFSTIKCVYIIIGISIPIVCTQGLRLTPAEWVESEVPRVTLQASKQLIVIYLEREFPRVAELPSLRVMGSRLNLLTPRSNSLPPGGPHARVCFCTCTILFKLLCLPNGL